MSKRVKKKKKKNAKRLKRIAETGADKAREAAQFVYKHRQKIMDAVELLGAVVGTASQIIGKPAKRKKPRGKRS